MIRMTNLRSPALRDRIITSYPDFLNSLETSCPSWKKMDQNFTFLKPTSQCIDILVSFFGQVDCFLYNAGYDIDDIVDT